MHYTQHCTQHITLHVHYLDGDPAPGSGAAVQVLGLICGTEGTLPDAPDYLEARVEMVLLVGQHK
jgi:hypothetical protein